MVTVEYAGARTNPSQRRANPHRLLSGRVLRAAALALTILIIWAAAAQAELISVRLVSANLEALPGSGECGYAGLSADGWWVAFATRSSGLVRGDHNRSADVFVAERRWNHPPTADAGPDRTVRTRNASVRVRLDGSKSSDAEGDPLRFTWFEGKRRIARGARPKVRLRRGRHTLRLRLDDPYHGTAADAIRITVQRQGR
jgi:hypothetical protein